LEKGNGSQELLLLKSLILQLLGPEGRRILSLRDKTNDEIFRLYTDDLKLRLRNEKNLRDTETLLDHFRNHLAGGRPSREEAKAFLAPYSKRAPRTLYRYTQTIKAFMNWYGETLDDVRVRVPKSLPAYTEDTDIEKLLEVIGLKRSHKGSIGRDCLLVKVGWRTGMRRGELASLQKQDIHGDFLIVRGGKGDKDRTIPLTEEIASELADFTKDMKPDQRVFGLGGPAIGMKVKQFSEKAGLKNFHTHSLRHKYATDLLESGANIKVVQALLGHENLNTTQAYLAITEKSLYGAVKQLDKHIKRHTTETEGDVTPLFDKEPDDIYLRDVEKHQKVISIEQHWKDLADTAAKLVNNLEVVRKYIYLGEEHIMNIRGDEADREQLQETDEFLNRCLLQHLQEELPQLAGVNNWGELRLKELTKEVMDALSAISWGRIPGGSCPICGKK
jgi:integrase/recombinase XerD